ncbi:helix-turn-helix domain-containing protein [Acidithiobacillus thiooxidans]|uniref:helix-turn-helix domain-containing protein n=1 Tax=Acidithiobacillus thiooxidans TaxID=930 RepID=UPI001F519097|nr:winged helix-turn-helix domain-containing protein [Acidithiobacillus thiooxidans]
MDLRERLVGKYLKRWGFTPQRPVKRALEQNPEVVRQWLEQDYPRLRAQAAQEGAVIYWGTRRPSRKMPIGCAGMHLGDKRRYCRFSPDGPRSP